MAKVPQYYPARYEGELLYPCLVEDTWNDAARAVGRSRLMLDGDRDAIEAVIDDYVVRSITRKTWAPSGQTMALLEKLSVSLAPQNILSRCDAMVKKSALRSLGLAGLPLATRKRLDGGDLTAADIESVRNAASTALAKLQRAFGDPGRNLKQPELLACLKGLAQTFRTRGGKISAHKAASRHHDEVVWSPFVRWTWSLLKSQKVPDEFRPTSISALGKFIERNKQSLV